MVASYRDVSPVLLMDYDVLPLRPISTALILIQITMPQIRFEPAPLGLIQRTSFDSDCDFDYLAPHTMNGYVQIQTSLCEVLTSL